MRPKSLIEASRIISEVYTDNLKIRANSPFVAFLDLNTRLVERFAEILDENISLKRKLQFREKYNNNIDKE